MKNKKRKNKIIFSITIILIIVLALIMGISYFRSDNYSKSNQEKKYKDIQTSVTTSDKNVVEEYQKEFNNTEIIAELDIPNTDIKVPVAQASDNEYYLNHLYSKEQNGLGSVFLDYRNTLSDKKIIIYGHNSQNVYTEFHTLENYLDSSYYKEHSNIYLQTIDTKYHYKIFSIYIAVDDFSHVNLKYDNDKYLEHLNWLKEQSIYDTGVNIKKNDKIIVLQTCYFTPKDSYLIVVGKMVNK